MMLEVMAYSVAVSAALTAVGHCLERLAELHRQARRSAWIAAMALSVLFPAGMIVGSRTVVIPENAVVAPVPANPAPSRTATAPVQTAAAPVQAAPATTARQPIWKLAAPSDNQLLVMWAIASSGFALYLFGASLLLRLRAARWQRMTVLGHEVLVSEVTGPALLGVMPPRIVVPRWLLQQPVATQSLILEHERQHMSARDPLLMVAGLFVIVAVPWNPFLWWQWRHMRHAMEMDCDSRVLRTGAEPVTYAAVLLHVTQRAARTPPGALAMSEPVSALERRIDHLAPVMAKYAGVQTIAVLGLAVVVAGVAVALDAPALPVRITPSATALVSPTNPQPSVFTAQALRAPPPEPALPTRAPAQPAPVVKHESSSQRQDGDNSMNKVRSIAVTVAALGATAAAQAQAPAPPPAATNGQRVTAEQIIASNDQDGDGIVTREEAAKANQGLHIMWPMYDGDRDGRVNAAEVERATNAMLLATAEEKITGQPSSGPAMVKPDFVVKNNDLNGDGIVTREEAMKSGASLARMWELYDLDKDGKVNAAEIGKAQGY